MTRKDRPTHPKPHLACTADEFKQLVRAGWSEAEFQQQVIDLAKRHGWLVAHFRKVRVQRKGGSVYWETPVAADGAGWPDLVLVHPKHGRILACELKTDRGKVTDAQRVWLSALNGAGVTAVLWRPSAWQAIERELGGGS